MRLINVENPRMQSDEQKFLLLDREPDWRRGYTHGVEIRAEGGLALALAPKFERAASLPEINAAAVALAFAAPSTLFVLDHLGRFHAYDKNTHELQAVVCQTEAGGNRFTAATGLAVGKETIYVTEQTRHRVHALLRSNYQTRYVLGKRDASAGKQPGEFDKPLAVALDREENLYVLDRNNRRIQKFNYRGKFLRQLSHAALRKPAALAVDHAGNVYVLNLGEPIAQSAQKPGLALDPRDAIQSLHPEPPSVFKFDDAGKFLQRIVLHGPSPRFHPQGFAMDAHGKFYMGDLREVENGGVHIFDKKGSYLGVCSGFRGQVVCLAFDNHDHLYVGGFSEGKSQLAHLASGKTFLRHGVYFSDRFDSTVELCRWHRLRLRAQVPAKTTLKAFCFISDEAQPKPPEEMRTDKVAWQPCFVSTVADPEALLPAGAGRYLWLKLELSGDEYHTPVVESLRVDFPRISYLRYLPRVYREKNAANDFVERFLALFETFLQESESNIFAMARYFDPRATPSEFLPWLGSWLAIASDESWEEEQKRKLIERGYALYKLKGTKAGLEQMIEIYTGQRPMVLEHFQYRRPMILGESAALGSNSVLGKKNTAPLQLPSLPQAEEFPWDAVLQADDAVLQPASSSQIGEFALHEEAPAAGEFFKETAYEFTVVVGTAHLQNEGQRRTLIRIIEEEKPAHTRYYLREVGKQSRAGADFFVGMSRLERSERDPSRLGQSSRLGRETIVLAQDLTPGKIGAHTHVGIDTILH